EAATLRVHRAATKPAADDDTMITNVFTGRPARSIVNRLVLEVGPFSTVAPSFPLALEAVMPLAKSEAHSARGLVRGQIFTRDGRLVASTSRSSCPWRGSGRPRNPRPLDLLCCARVGGADGGPA